MSRFVAIDDIIARGGCQVDTGVKGVKAAEDERGADIFRRTSDSSWRRRSRGARAVNAIIASAGQRRDHEAWARKQRRLMLMLKNGITLSSNRAVNTKT